MQPTFAKSIKCAAAVTVLASVFSIEWIIFNTVAPQREATEIRKLIESVNLPPQARFHEKLDAVRSFVNDHSQHKIDKFFYIIRSGRFPYSFADGLIAHANDPSSERIHMECASRASVMGDILTQLGYQARNIAIYNTAHKIPLASHSFLEVLNPETNKWETQDPDYDIYWRRVSTHERVSMVETSQSLTDVEPCGRTSCGWDIKSREGIEARTLKDYFDIISVNWTGDKRHAEYSVYTRRANLGRAYTVRNKTGHFCNILPQQCRDGFHEIGGASPQNFSNEDTDFHRMAASSRKTFN
jgi:hypothetical protein